MADQVYNQSLSDFITNAPTTKLTRIFQNNFVNARALDEK